MYTLINIDLTNWLFTYSIMVDLWTADSINMFLLLCYCTCLMLIFNCISKRAEAISDNKNGTCYHTLFVFSCLPRGCWTTISVVLSIKGPKEEGWVLKYVLAYLWWSYTTFALSITYIAHLHHPYIESLTTLIIREQKLETTCTWRSLFRPKPRLCICVLKFNFWNICVSMGRLRRPVVLFAVFKWLFTYNIATLMQLFFKNSPKSISTIIWSS